VRRLLVLALVSAACAVVPATTTGAPAPVAPLTDRPVWPLTAQGRWVTDAQGRVVIVHGVNLTARAAPFQVMAAGFGDDDAELLRRAGFSAVRLAVVPAAVMPRPGAIDRRYLDGVLRTVRLLARHGLMTLVVLHQEQWGARYLGSGLPGWMTLDDHVATGPRLRPPDGYLTNPALARAFQSFWANRTGPGDVGLEDRWTQIAGAVARRLAHEHTLAGYDLMNAPWPGGSTWKDCLRDGCRGFQRVRLAKLWRRSVAMVRSVDPDAITWIEPPPLVPIAGPLLLPATGDRHRSGLAFQADCGLAAAASPAAAARPCGALQARALDQAAAWSAEATRPALLTGGAAVRRGATVDGLRRLADTRMLSWLRWSYAAVPATPGDPPGIVHDLARPARGANVDDARLGALDVPYPRLVAGTPDGWSMTRATGVFRASWGTVLPSGVRAADGAVSEIWLGRRAFPAGYRLTVTGARVALRTADRVVLRALPGATRVTVRAAPAAHAAG